MQLAQYKHHFLKTLDVLYDKQEVLNFYHMLTAHYLQKSRLDLALAPHLELNAKQLMLFNTALEALKKEKPIQYIVGEATFCDMTFKVNKNTLIPRPETEELVAWLVESVSKTKPLKILDIGTGSGCIAIALAKQLPNAVVSALDFSAKALEVAKQNALLNDVALHFIQQDILKTTELTANYDVIISNPPYVKMNEKSEIANNVLQYEPDSALFVADNDPLIFYAKIATLARETLVKDGLLFFEINQYLGQKTVDLITTKGFGEVLLKCDIFKNDRMIRAKK